MKGKTSKPVRIFDVFLYLFSGLFAIVLIVFVVIMTKQVVWHMKQSSMETLLQDQVEFSQSYHRNEPNFQPVESDDVPVPDVIVPSETPTEDELPPSTDDACVTESTNGVYHIQSGDTLSGISSYVHYSVDELAIYNEIRNVDLIYAGSTLRIPQE